jgi:serine/threonine-protein kinase
MTASAASMKTCPDENMLVALVMDKLSRMLAEPLQYHVEGCRRCQLGVAEAARAVLKAEPSEQAETVRELVAGDQIDGRFALESLIGQGGCGTVWSARRVSDSQRVAIKVLHSVQPDGTKRLHREAKFSRRLTHPAFVPVHEVLEVAPDRPALIMDLLEGEDLARFLLRGPKLPAHEAVAILAPIAEALETLHFQQIAHRDLKPANVFLERVAAGVRVRILDLGLARSLRLESETLNTSPLTAMGTILGTPHYMSPEQLDGKCDVDTRADIWAMGALAYRMLSGEPHIAAWRFSDVVRAIHTQRIPELSQRVPDVPAPLAKLVRESLVVERELRPPAAAWATTLKSM